MEFQLSWAADLGLTPRWVLDDLSLVLVVLVGVVGVAVGAWIAIERRPDTRRLVMLLGTFLVAMVLLLGAADGLTLFIAWEATSVLSYLMVGFDRTPAALRAARTTLVVTGLGGVVLLVAVLLVGSATGTFVLQEWLQADPTDPLIAVAAWLFLVAAATKSAQVPVHGWLVGAGTAPTPASALLHAATLVVAGVYLVARLAPLLAGVAGWTVAATALGLTTFVVGHVIAARRRQAKAVLAATTAAQLGLALAVASAGTSEAIAVAVGLLVVHGSYKAALFLVAGSVKNATGDASVGALWPGTRLRPGLRAALVLGALALSGAPPLAGWATKEAAVDHLLAQSPVAALGVALGAALGVVVAVRLVGGLRRRAQPTDTRAPITATSCPSRVSKTLIPPDGSRRFAAAPMLALLVPVVVLGSWTEPLQAAARAAGTAVVDGDGAKIVLWPGMTTALVISLTALAVGVLAARGHGIARSPTAADGAAEPGPEVTALGTAIDTVLQRCAGAARWVDALDRPAVVAVVAGTSFSLLALIGLSSAAGASPLATLPPIASSPAQVLAVVVLVAGVGGTVVVRERVAAAVLLGVVGFAVAALFAIHGAPDLVLTQVVVEVVVVVVFVGVLLRLPPRSRRQRLRDRQGVTSVVIAALAGGAAGLLALRAASATGPRPLARDVADAAVPVGAGRNVVNVILTDFRALDTIGELAVLFLAAVAVLALVQVADRRRPVVATVPVSDLLDRATPVLTRVSIVMAVHLLLVGHDQPGGGFVGGLVLGAGIALHRLGTGRLPAPRLLRHPHAILAAGMAVVGAVAVAPLAVGRALADMGATTVDLGIFGAPKLTSALVLDIGVVLVVVGLVVAALATLGSGPAVRSTDEAPTTGEPGVPRRDPTTQGRP